MSKLKDAYWRWLTEQLTWIDKVLAVGAMTWLILCVSFRLPKPDLKTPAWWTSPVFFVVGLVSSLFFWIRTWWCGLQIRWISWMMSV
jgi:hypothetical protein